MGLGEEEGDHKHQITNCTRSKVKLGLGFSGGVGWGGGIGVGGCAVALVREGGG